MVICINYSRIIKLGAFVSTIGVSMLILFGSILLLFPVVKTCDESCTYVSNAPDYLSQLITPSFLFVSLILISVGVFLIRIGNRQLYKHK